MRKYLIALYIRLSLEDSKTESMSIPNQRLILQEKAMSLPEWENAEVREFVDNGHSGMNFERPAVQELLEMVQAGKVDCIIVKDLSRFGRNSIETGYKPFARLTTKVFAARVYGVCLVLFVYPADIHAVTLAEDLNLFIVIVKINLEILYDNLFQCLI